MSQGAHIAGCKQIIAVDKVQERIDLAKNVFGATHGLNTSGLTDLTAAMKDIAEGRGPTVVIESKFSTLSPNHHGANEDFPTSNRLPSRPRVVLLLSRHKRFFCPSWRSCRSSISTLHGCGTAPLPRREYVRMCRRGFCAGDVHSRTD